MKTYEVTVTAVYIGSVEVEADSPEHAQLLVTTNHNGCLNGVDLDFSEYDSFDLGEEIE